MPLSLPPPRDWQDFEDLCCDLWSKLWSYPETTRNGRSGQAQKGVDIYGREGPDWVGVQCKYKDQLIAGKLTVKTIENAIVKARQFEPPLSRFVIATTAVRDAKLQETVRYLDEVERRSGSFSVTVFFWEDIVLNLCNFPETAQKYYPDAFPRFEKASGITKNLLELFESHSMKLKETQDELYESIQLHLVEALNWSQTVQFDGMTQAEETDDRTISLALDTIPRRFQGKVDGFSEKIHESVLLEERKHFVLLGSPGSGKTTTLKRLARTLLLQPSPSDQCPVVVRLVDYGKYSSLWRMIADSIGIFYEARLEPARRKLPNLHGSDDKDNFEYFVSSTPLDHVIPRILDSTNAVILLDGLDEVSLDRRDSVEREIEMLALRLSRSKIILSCRSGDYSRPLGNFTLVELCPLELKQIEELCSRWLEKPEEFCEALSALPYYDLARRPLFLCHLIVGFKQAGYLPDQPAGVYEDMLRLFLEKWDKERRIYRASRYSQFGPDRKKKFLAALAYHLSYKSKVKSFSTQVLVRAYEAICDDYGLPPLEAEQVAREIETHTGIIFETRGGFEFSHLSFQEYLCADYLVRDTFAEFMLDYLQEYPAPIAVAVSLAGSPSNWFANIILAKNGRHNLNERTLPPLLSRLVQEQPHFSRSENLGFSIFSIIFGFLEQTQSYIQTLLSLSVVQDSVILALSYYKVYMQGEILNFYLADSFTSKYDLQLPASGALPSQFFNQLLETCKLQVEQVAIGGKILLLFRRQNGELI
ncbi:MAG TPA: hypothetical protein VN493_31090 [Thermoanaerobaculia bacterium]|nr:hypothetical protein [Thermoanaerobaculia bacterium]